MFTVEYKGVTMHFGTHWVVTATEGDFRLQDGTAVKLLVEVHRPSMELHATTAAVSKSNGRH
ncbi:MAG: hypothetical protein LLG14_12940 [Nocardiaceae bacterium]|nr:hypothetical protein [Nocardiaceae bacterium]